MEEQDQIRLEKRMRNYLDFKFKTVKWIQDNKEAILKLMISAYTTAISDSQNQGLEEDIKID